MSRTEIPQKLTVRHQYVVVKVYILKEVVLSSKFE